MSHKFFLSNTFFEGFKILQANRRLIHETVIYYRNTQNECKEIISKPSKGMKEVKHWLELEPKEPEKSVKYPRINRRHRRIRRGMLTS